MTFQYSVARFQAGFRLRLLFAMVLAVAGLVVPAVGQGGNTYYQLYSNAGFLIPTGPGWPYASRRLPPAKARALTLGVPYDQPYQLEVRMGFIEVRLGTRDGQIVVTAPTGLPWGDEETTTLNGPAIGAAPRYGDANGDGLIDDRDIEALQAAFGLSDEDPGFPANLDLDSDGFITLADHEKLVALMSKPPLARQTFWLRRADTTPPPFPYPPVPYFSIFSTDPGDILIRVCSPSATSYDTPSLTSQWATAFWIGRNIGTWRFPTDTFSFIHVPAGGPLDRLATSRVRLKGRYEPLSGPNPLIPELSLELPGAQIPLADRSWYENGQLPSEEMYLDPFFICRQIPGFSPFGLVPGSLAEGATLSVWCGGPGSTTRVDYPLYDSRGTQERKVTVDPFPAQWFRPVYVALDTDEVNDAIWCGDYVDREANPTVPLGLKYYDFATLSLTNLGPGPVPLDYPKKQRWAHYVFNFVSPDYSDGGQPPNATGTVDVISLKPDGTELARTSGVPVDFITDYPQGATRSILEWAFPGITWDFPYIFEYQSRASEPLVFVDADPPPGGFPGVRALKVQTGGTVIVIPRGFGW
jgi:hypothetical protein